MSTERSWKKMWAINFVALALVSGVLIVLAARRLIQTSFAISFIVMMAAAMVFMFLRQRTNKGSRPDERIKRLTSRAMGLSWQFTVVGVVVAYLFDYLRVFSLSSSQVLLAIVLFMEFSFFVIVLILRKVGDVTE